MLCASGSAVEHLLAKERVAGSSPVSRLFLWNALSVKTGFFFVILSVKLSKNCTIYSDLMVQ